jgi:hypothetical protein
MCSAEVGNDGIGPRKGVGQAQKSETTLVRLRAEHLAVFGIPRDVRRPVDVRIARTRPTPQPVIR